MVAIINDGLVLDGRLPSPRFGFPLAAAPRRVEAILHIALQGTD